MTSTMESNRYPDMQLANQEENSPLVRSLGLRDSLAIVIGSMIGTGVFLKTAIMTQEVGSAFWVTMAWLAAGVLSLLGAMTYAELGALFPHAGGGYVYVREAYGRFPAFLAGWISFWILYPGSVAAYGVAAATFLSGVLPVESLGGPNAIALGLIVFFGALNCLAVSFGGLVQSILTGLKVLAILGLTIGIFWFSPHPFLTAHGSSATPAWGMFGAATLAALWAFDGWEGIARVAGEVRNPQRNVPLSLLIGILVVFGLYASINLAYFWALPIDEILNSNSSQFPNALPVATKAAASFLGGNGIQILSIVFLISTIGAMNGSMLTAARVPFAMARDRLFFKYFDKVSKHTRVPVRAIWAQAIVSCILALSGTFDQLTNYVVFSAWIFYGLTGFTVFIFRKRLPNAQRGYRVPWYPWVPAIFVIMAAALVITTLIESPKESLIGVGMILSGVPFYFWLFRNRKVTNSL